MIPPWIRPKMAGQRGLDFFLLSQWLTFGTFGDYIFSRENKVQTRDEKLGGGFKYFLFSSLPGEDSHFDSYFSNGLKPPTSFSFMWQTEMNRRKTLHSLKLTAKTPENRPKLPRKETIAIILAIHFGGKIPLIFLDGKHPWLQTFLWWMLGGDESKLPKILLR